MDAQRAFHKFHLLLWLEICKWVPHFSSIWKRIFVVVAEEYFQLLQKYIHSLPHKATQEQGFHTRVNCPFAEEVSTLTADNFN